MHPSMLVSRPLSLAVLALPVQFLYQYQSKDALKSFRRACQPTRVELMEQQVKFQ